jgi:hypothetical protein
MPQSKKGEAIRCKWWRSVEGEVFEEEGFAFEDEPDMFYFGTEPIGEDAACMQHVDDLYTTREAAVVHALEFLERRREQDRQKLAALRSGAELSRVAAPSEPLCKGCQLPRQTIDQSGYCITCRVVRPAK